MEGGSNLWFSVARRRWCQCNGGRLKWHKELVTCVFTTTVSIGAAGADIDGASVRRSICSAVFSLDDRRWRGLAP
jgi:hypothetical protein